jgi:hypothetical protein
MMLARGVHVCAAMLALRVAAQETASSEHPSNGGHDTPVRMPPGYRGNSADKMRLEVHRRLPGFAGLYFDGERQRYVIRIKRGHPLPEHAATRDAVSEVMGIPGASLESAVYEESNYDFAELLELKDRITAAFVTNEMTGLGIDTERGRVLIGVRDRKKSTGTEAMLKRLGVPPAAVEIWEISPVVPQGALQVPRQSTSVEAKESRQSE